MRIQAFLFVVALVLSLPAFAEKPKTLGGPITLTEKMTLSKAASDFDPKRSKDVLVEAKVEQVCQQKGCWMQVSDGQTKMRMTFKGYSFFVPKDSGGKNVLAQGHIVEKEESVKDQKHYLEDAGAPKSEIDAIREPKKTKSFVAAGLQFLN